MTTTHIWPGSDRTLAADQPDVVHGFFTVVVDYFGRSAVPLLSLFSGLLLVSSLRRRGLGGEAVWSKFRALIVPLIFWSALALVAMFASELLLDRDEGVPTSPLDWLNALTSFESQPANGPLHFLREIFIAGLYGMVVFAVFNWRRWAAYALIVAILSWEFLPGDYIMFRPQIATLFFAGMLMALHNRANWRPPLLLGLAVLAVSELVMNLLTSFPADGSVGDTALAHLPRLAMSLITWWLAVKVAELSTRATAFINWLEPHIFVVFCSHRITVFGVGGLISKTNITENDPIYLAIFIAQVPLCVAVAVVASHLLRNFAPANGGRTPPPLRFKSSAAAT